MSAARITALLRQSGWYVAAGAGATAVTAGLFLLLREPLGPFAANLTAIVITTVANTEFHRRVTFHAPHSPRRRQAAAVGVTVMFYASYSSTALFLLHLLVDSPTAAQQTTAIVSATLLGGIARFALLRVWVFSPQPAR
jgi:putative flippase GtrA